MTTLDNDDERDIWWCKRTDGQIVEHQTTEFENHRGHVQCIPIDGNRQATTAQGGAMTNQGNDA